MKDKVLTGLDIKSGAEGVLKALIQLGGRASASEVSDLLNKPKSSVYDSLEDLMSQGLIVEESGERGKVFAVSDIRQIEQIKERKVSEVQNTFSEIVRMVSENVEKKVSKPRIRFYSGIEGMRQAFRDISWNSEYRETYLMWPMKDMIERLGEDFLKHHGNGRFIHQVMLYSIRKESDRDLDNESHEWLKNDKEEKLREVRYAPKDMQWSMSYWIYGDQVLFSGSGDEIFAFIVKSKDFANLMKLLWQNTWMQIKN